MSICRTKSLLAHPFHIISLPLFHDFMSPSPFYQHGSLLALYFFYFWFNFSILWLPLTHFLSQANTLKWEQWQQNEKIERKNCYKNNKKILYVYEYATASEWRRRRRRRRFIWTCFYATYQRREIEVICGLISWILTIDEYILYSLAVILDDSLPWSRPSHSTAQHIIIIAICGKIYSEKNEAVLYAIEKCFRLYI